MIKHVVVFKLKEGESKEKAKQVLLSMQGNVPMIKDIQVGTDLLGSARSFDVYLSVVLDDLKALEDYQVDAYHCDVVKKHMHAVTEKSVAIDFEI